ncbi:MAG: hypothetical protein ACTSX1_11370 [Candidatus Heimdallarchaeaceae archaeon]
MKLRSPCNNYFQGSGHAGISKKGLPPNGVALSGGDTYYRKIYHLESSY